MFQQKLLRSLGTSGIVRANEPLMRLFLGIVILLAAVGCRTNESPEAQVSDAQIMASVKAKLVEGVGAATVTNISVNVTKGVVTLAGTVHTPDEKSKAVSIAQAVPKVASVNDNLQVAGSS
jgi:osmotically-inducible protein OsmY